MKDQADSKTIDAFGGSAKRGRKPKYSNAAEKQRAYRQRVAAKKAEAGITKGAINMAIDYALERMNEAPEWMIEALESLRPKHR